MVRAALPHQRAQGGGRIIQISTYGGQAALPGGSLYHASKWGIEGFIDAVGQEVATFNIGVTIVPAARARIQVWQRQTRSSDGRPSIRNILSPVFTFRS